MTAIRVFVADDHPVYREGLARHWADLDTISVVGSAGDGADAITAIVASRPDEFAKFLAEDVAYQAVVNKRIGITPK